MMASARTRTSTSLNMRDSFVQHAATIYPMVMKNRRTTIKRNIWGPHLWRFFHASGYYLSSITDEKIRCEKTSQLWKHTKDILYTIPCPACRKHAMAEYTTTRYEEPNDAKCDWFQKWAFNFHNKVNGRLRKPILSWETSVEISSSLNLNEQLKEYYDSINGWRHVKLDGILQSIQTITTLPVETLPDE